MSKIFCPSGDGCQYDGAVAFIKAMFGESYVNGILGVGNVGSTASPFTQDIIMYLAAIILFVLVVVFLVGLMKKPFSMGDSGELDKDQKGIMPYLRPLLAVLFIAPVGPYPLVVYFVLTLSLLGNGFANNLYQQYFGKYIDNVDTNKIFQADSRNPYGTKNPEASANANPTLKNDFSSSNTLQTTPALLLHQANDMQKYAFYGAVHGACVARLKEGIGGNEYAVISPMLIENERGNISISFKNQKSQNQGGFFGFFRPSNTLQDQGTEFGAGLVDVCGRVDFDFFTPEEFKDRYKDYLRNNSGTKAEQSIRTKSVQDKWNKVMYNMYTTAAQVNNARTMQAFRTYVSAFAMAGGNKVQNQCSSMEEQFVRHGSDIFSSETIADAAWFHDNGAGLGFGIGQVDTATVTGYSTPTALLTAATGFASSAGNEQQSTRGSFSAVKEASGVCKQGRGTGSPWPVAESEKDVVEATTASSGSGTSGGAGNGLKFFDAKGIYVLAKLSEQTLFNHQLSIVNGKVDSQQNRAELSALRREINEKLVARGWIYMPEASVVMRNMQNSAQGMYYAGSGSARVHGANQEEHNEVDNYNNYLTVTGRYFRSAFAAYGALGPDVSPELGAAIRIGGLNAKEAHMGNVLDGAVQTGLVRQIQASLLVNLSGDKLVTDPIGGLVELGNSAILGSMALEAMASGFMKSAMMGAAVGTAATATPKGTVAGAVGGVATNLALAALDAFSDRVRPALDEIINALDTVGHFLSVIVPTFPVILLNIAAIAWIMQIVLSCIGIMLWLILAAVPSNSFIGQVQQVAVTLLSVTFRPMLIVSGYVLASLLAGTAMLYIIESWFTTKSLLSMEADGAVSQFIMEVVLFKWDLYRLAAVITIVFYFIFSWIQELADEVFQFLGTNLLPTFGDVKSARIADGIKGGSLGQGDVGAGVRRLAAKKDRWDKQAAEEKNKNNQGGGTGVSGGGMAGASGNPGSAAASGSNKPTKWGRAKSIVKGAATVATGRSVETWGKSFKDKK